MRNLDLSFVRQQFPSLTNDWILMDNAGGSQVLQQVGERVKSYLLSPSNVQHGASYAPSQQAMAKVREATEAMATYVNAGDAGEIVMGGSATMLFRLLSICFSRKLKAGEEIIISAADHEANVSPWTDLERQGVKIQTWEVRPETMRLHLEDLEPLMNAHTRLVCVTHTSNVLGTLYPIREISDFVHEKGALIVVDGVAHAPHRLVDVQALDADFYVLSTYKVYGPHYGLLYGKKEHLLELPGINHSFIQENDIPYKFQPGNTNFELTYGMLGLTDYLQAAYAHHFDGEAPSLREQMVAVFDLIAEHEAQLSQRLLEFLLSKAGVRIVGEKDWHKELRVPTISFVAEGKRSDELVQQVDAANIGIRYGDFYAKKLIDSLGLRSYHGVVRVSMVHYNTLEEVDRLIEVLDRIL